MDLLLLFAPGVIASFYYCKQKDIPLKSVDFSAFIVIFAFLNLLLITGIMYIRGHKNGQVIEIFSIIGNVARYGIIALISSLTFPNILLLLERIINNKKNE